eukprot:5869246-Ditylum_brightwellii.AAC.1
MAKPKSQAPKQPPKEKNQRVTNSNANTTNDSSDQSKKKDAVCLICGSSLQRISTLKGRVNHYKRCSKKYGVSLKDVRCDFKDDDFAIDDDDDDDACEKDDGKKTDEHQSFDGEENSKTPSPTTTTTTSPSLFSIPTITAATAIASSSLQQAKQSMVTTFFQTKPKTLTQVLMAGAKQLAKASKLEEQHSIGKQSNYGNQKQQGFKRGGRSRWAKRSN